MTTEATTKAPVKHGKKFKKALELVDRAATYTPQEAAALAKKAAYAKFNETVELHITTSCDPRQADQQVRGTIVLPHGLGKEMRVLVFAQGEAAKAAQEAGADSVGADDLIKQIQGGWLDFDVAIATPDMMGKTGRLGPILGRRGLMPNPRSGTIVQPGDLARAVGEAKKGRVEYKLDKTGIIHVPIGKISFDERQLTENLIALVTAVNRARPAGVKGTFIQNITLKTTMGPGIKLNLPSILALKAV